MLSHRHLKSALAVATILCIFSSAFDSRIIIEDTAFTSLLGSSPEVIELTKATSQFYHEGASYHAPTKSLWTASDMMKSGNTTVRLIHRLTHLESRKSLRIEQINHTVPNPIGAVANVRGSPLGDVLLYAAQGTLAKSPPGGVYALNPYPPYNSSLVLGSYGEYPFNSLDDIAVTSDGVIWVSDPPLGKRVGTRCDEERTAGCD